MLTPPSAWQPTSLPHHSWRTRQRTHPAHIPREVSGNPRGPSPSSTDWCCSGAPRETSLRCEPRPRGRASAHRARVRAKGSSPGSWISMNQGGLLRTRTSRDLYPGCLTVSDRITADQVVSRMSRSGRDELGLCLRVAPDKSVVLVEDEDEEPTVFARQGLVIAARKWAARYWRKRAGSLTRSATASASRSGSSSWAETSSAPLGATSAASASADSGLPVSGSVSFADRVAWARGAAGSPGPEASHTIPHRARGRAVPLLSAQPG